MKIANRLLAVTAFILTPVIGFSGDHNEIYLTLQNGKVKRIPSQLEREVFREAVLDQMKIVMDRLMKIEEEIQVIYEQQASLRLLIDAYMNNQNVSN